MAITTIAEPIGLFDDFSAPRERAVVQCGDKRITQLQLLLASETVGDLFPFEEFAAASPDRRYVINLCKNRYHFIVGFCAALIKGCVSLLPSNRQHQTIADLFQLYPNSVVLVDADDDAFNEFRCVTFPALSVQEPQREPTCPVIDGKQTAAIVFTSGSTGTPTAIEKQWRTFVGTTQLLAKRFFSTQYSSERALVATVPPQHMYGLETTVMMALHGGATVYSAQPFYPEDINKALKAIAAPRVLVTTPIHMSALVASEVVLPSVERILSATAPLERALAEQAEDQFECRVSEIFGCSEAGSFATRNPLQTTEWSLLDTMKLHQESNEDNESSVIISAQHLSFDVELQDQLRVLDDHHFEFMGRSADMLNVAGKRASLSDLTLKLKSIEGVEDAVFFIPQKNGKPSKRPAALVISELPEREITMALALLIDSVFIPRPMKKVSHIPRNELGKIPNHLLQQQLGW